MPGAALFRALFLERSARLIFLLLHVLLFCLEPPRAVLPDMVVKPPGIDARELVAVWLEEVSVDVWRPPKCALGRLAAPCALSRVAGVYRPSWGVLAGHHCFLPRASLSSRLWP